MSYPAFQNILPKSYTALGHELRVSVYVSYNLAPIGIKALCPLPEPSPWWSPHTPLYGPLPSANGMRASQGTNE